MFITTKKLDFNSALKSLNHKKTEPNLDSVSLYFI